MEEMSEMPGWPEFLSEILLVSIMNVLIVACISICR